MGDLATTSNGPTSPLPWNLQAGPVYNGTDHNAQPPHHPYNEQDRYSQMPNATPLEIATLIVMATIGMIGNFGIIIMILVLSNLRRASNAFLFHHCLLDFLKAAYCLPFAQTMMGHQPTLYCSMLGSSYIVFVTSSSFNLLAMVMNEAYHFADLILGIKDSRNYCCVIFGIFIIWFSSVIMNLGVAFIPGNPSFDRKLEHCIFVYGITRNYVLHILWIVLISLAMALTATYLRKLFLDIKRSDYYRMSTLIRATVTLDTQTNSDRQRRDHEVRERHHIKHVQHITTKKLYLLILLTICFILFWYPLFIVTTSDPRFNVSPDTYKALTIFAWSNPTISPFILFFLTKTGCCFSEADSDSCLDRDSGEDGPYGNMQIDGHLCHNDTSDKDTHCEGDNCGREPKHKGLGKKSRPTSLWM